MELTTEDYINMSKRLETVRQEIGQFIVGQKEAVEFSIYCVLADGHALLEGLPGLGKTMLIRTVSEVLDLSFSRIQFTPDLMPSDITGTSMIERLESGKQQFSFQKGPIFSQMVLADEINRATPKTQSALLEAMGEKTVTVLGDTKKMDRPFFVLATQNPIEMEGTYPLPEAQMDRFLCKIIVSYPTKDELIEITKRTTGSQDIRLNKVMNAEDLIIAQQMVKEVLIADDMLEYAVDLIAATHPESSVVPEVQQYVQYGSGPRGLQSLIKLAKARALVSGRYHVSIADIKTVVKPVLRHRLLLNYEGEAEGKSTDDLIEIILQTVKQGQSV
ncbi:MULTISPECIES: MoxR family ATPase [unclassified Psychrobacillus]|uniref:AAA family ATPase n=1 Tax=unclassified Psychrobacillus TaxID=2636677 RepID=UPI00146AE7C5|nr:MULTISPECIES: MoxR family ATPase [unclassified Psychrobacillus]MCM3358996.1 MoxR family ATPase [Psychrobacillus sp. MER TA 171]NME05155.1 MoxR family ATPase [Psychrobacillus sp. BL-248-WT-3]